MATNDCPPFQRFNPRATRRGSRMQTLVREREMAAAAIARRFKPTRRAVSQHIARTCDVGLVDGRRTGAALYVVRSEGFAELVNYFKGFWRPRLRQPKHVAEAVERSKRTK